MKFSKEFILISALASLGTVAVAQTKSGAQTAKPKVVHQEEFFIVGIEAAKETSAQGVIPQQ